MSRTAFGDLPDIMSRKEVAEYVGLGLATLNRWATEGKGPKYRKAGSRVIYKKVDVLAWIESLEESA